MRLRKLKYAVFLLCFASIFTTPVAAGDVIRSVKRLDISDGYFTGAEAEYYFYIPSEWQGLVFIDRVILSDDNRSELERLNFYCISDSGRYKHALMFSLYVFTPASWKNEFSFEIALRNNDYIFAVDYSGAKGFSYTPDQNLFKAMSKYTDTPDKVKNLIEIAGSGGTVKKKKVYISNVAISSPPIEVEGAYYIPLRDAAEALGYTVKWRWDSSVEILKPWPDQFFDNFKIDASTKHDKRGIKMRIINDRTYVHTEYFIKIMKKVVEVDDEGNIFISNRK